MLLIYTRETKHPMLTAHDERFEGGIDPQPWLGPRGPRRSIPLRGRSSSRFYWCRIVACVAVKSEREALR